MKIVRRDIVPDGPGSVKVRPPPFTPNSYSSSFLFQIFLQPLQIWIEFFGKFLIQMVPVDSDDLWYVYNLIAPGDSVMAVTVRYYYLFFFEQNWKLNLSMLPGSAQFRIFFFFESSFGAWIFPELIYECVCVCVVGVNFFWLVQLWWGNFLLLFPECVFWRFVTLCFVGFLSSCPFLLFNSINVLAFSWRKYLCYLLLLWVMGPLIACMNTLGLSHWFSVSFSC